MKYNIFLIGPAGSGKTTLGRYYAKKQKINFFECDRVHNKKNILKMKNGITITQQERLTWVKRIKNKLSKKSKINLVIAFSGLIKFHRKMLCHQNKKNLFFFLKTSNKTLKKRLNKRKNHFFNPKNYFDQIKLFQKSDDLITLNSNKSLFYNYKKINTIIKFD